MLNNQHRTKQDWNQIRKWSIHLQWIWIDNHSKPISISTINNNQTETCTLKDNVWIKKNKKKKCRHQQRGELAAAFNPQLDPRLPRKHSKSVTVGGRRRRAACTLPPALEQQPARQVSRYGHLFHQPESYAHALHSITTDCNVHTFTPILHPTVPISSIYSMLMCTAFVLQCLSIKNQC